MVGTLASKDDLWAFTGETSETLAPEIADVLLEIATGEVQAAAGQDLLRVTDDEFDVTGTTDSWLYLPQRPVVSVSSVEIDGQAVTDFKKRGNRLWRCDGWACNPYEPTAVTGLYTHGYEVGDTRLWLARKHTLSVAAYLRSNPSGATGMSIDDYREQYGQGTDARIDLLPKLAQQLLRRTYGARAGIVRVG